MIRAATTRLATNRLTTNRLTTNRLIGVLLVGVTLLGACGGDNSAIGTITSATSPQRVEVVSPAPATSTVSETTVPPTVIAESTVAQTPVPITTIPDSGPQTTIAPTPAPPTTPAPQLPPGAPATLPTPVAAPSDSRGKEAVVQVGSIEIPKIGLATTMYEGIRLTTLDRGPGHWPGTAMPGAVGNVVVGGHRTSHDKPFRNIDKLQPGDQVIFDTADGRFVYAVTSTEIVTPDAIRIIDQTAGKTATLFACHPLGSTRQRIVVHLALVDA